MTTVYRPVTASPPQMNEAVIDPKTGKFTPAGHRRITELWKRTGGFTDDVGALLGLISISQTSSLTASSNEEKTRRMIGEALQQVQGQNVERLRSMFEDFRKTSDTHFGQLLGGLARPPQTRVIQFSANDTWRLNPDVRAIRVVLVAGGGGGGAGSSGGTEAGGGGGAGGGYSTADFNAAELPASVAITVGVGGVGGTDSTSATAGGDSSFGTLIIASGGGQGGVGSVTAGAGGSADQNYGSLFFGGNGGNGTLVSGVAATNDCQGAPGGGGGGGYNAGNGGAGGAGSWRTTASSGGGGAGGATGTNGSPGVLPVNGDVYIGPGLGGGGGGGASTGNGGDGAAGVLGGGGGGGGAIGTAGTLPGFGGAGGDGRVWVLEYY